MNITNIYADPDCPDCNGTGERDSGGTHPWGEPIYLACDCVDAQIGKRWRTNSSLENWFPLTAEKLGQLSSDLEDAQGEIRALRATEAGLVERVKDLERIAAAMLPFADDAASINGYGYYRPENPHNFHPDAESCSADEIAAHKAACDAWDAGTYKDNYGDGRASPNVHILRAPWGIGSYTDEVPEIAAICNRARALLEKKE